MDKEDRKALLVRMSEDLHKQLKIKAIEEGDNMTSIVLRLIEQYLDQHEEKE